jgi:hypothetical protein
MALTLVEEVVHADGAADVTDLARVFAPDGELNLFARTWFRSLCVPSVVVESSADGGDSWVVVADLGELPDAYGDASVSFGDGDGLRVRWMINPRPGWERPVGSWLWVWLDSRPSPLAPPW